MKKCKPAKKMAVKKSKVKDSERMEKMRGKMDNEMGEGMYVKPGPKMM